MSSAPDLASYPPTNIVSRYPSGATAIGVGEYWM